MQLSEVLRAQAEQKWIADRGASTAFRLHFGNLPNEEGRLENLLAEVGVGIKLPLLFQSVSAAGPSLKFDGASVIAFNVPPGSVADVELSFGDYEVGLAQAGVICVETGEVQLNPSPFAVYSVGNELVN